LNEDEKIMLSFFRKAEALNRLEQYTILLTMDNNHKEVIARLEEKGLIFKDAQSPEIYPIYRVERLILKSDFDDELKRIFGNEWANLKLEYREILNAIYAHNTFGNKSEPVSANSIGTYIYSLKNKELIDLNDYENYKRKVRSLFNQLEIRYFIMRKDGKSKGDKGKPDFMINKDYEAPKDRFNF
jgi:ATP-dependent DNA helicase RecG